MAPPIPGLRPPVQVQQRTASDVVFGVLAVLALVALTIGVPIALISVFGVPIPHHLSTSFLTSQLDVMSVLKVLAVAVWILWIQLVWCVIVEIRAAVRNVGVPDRVPLAGPTQSAAHRLVSAALLLFSATAALAPAISHVSSVPRPAYTAQVRPVDQAPRQAHTPVEAHEPVRSTPTTEKIYVVQPPEGRFHESLWEIAQNHLGDGRRYREIFELNSGRIQPDGSKLTIASLIRPGWVLRMPSDAHGPGIRTVAEHERASSGHEHTDGSKVASAQADGPGVTAPVAAGGGEAGTVNMPSASGATRQAGSPVWPYELSSASLLAAGVLVALGRRRRERLWQRAFGMRLAEPTGASATAEQALILGADDPGVAVLDRGLRQLIRGLAEQGRIPPNVYAAHLGEDHLDLWVAPPDQNAPSPWTVADDGQVWRLSADAVVEPGYGTPAPYPGLVSIGTDPAGRVLVDLEVANGVIALRGPDAMVRAALAALAVELVTNRWSDRMRVTLVGFGADLTLISPQRVRSVSSVDEILPELEKRAVEMEKLLDDAGFDSALTGRSAGNPDDFAPHYLIVGTPLTQRQADRLLVLSRGRHRMASGYVVAGDVAGAAWTWDVTEDGRLKAGVLGFDLRAQLLPPEQYQAVVDLFRDTDTVMLSNPAVGAALGPMLRPDVPAAAEIGILGPAVVRAPGEMEPDRLPLATEIVAYLAAHPGGTHLNVLTGAIWPRGVSAEIRDAALARVTSWLGGEDNLRREADGRISLGPTVRVDWQVFRGLIAQAAAASAAGNVPGAGEAELGFLTSALSLVRGPVLEGRDKRRYVWIGPDAVLHEATALVADAAHRLSALRYSARDPEGAMEAARSGLRLAPDDEQLWRDLLMAAHATGTEHVLRAVVGEVCAHVASDDVRPRMAPETEALIDELFPSWRELAA
jgi:hypothetical protein